MSLASCTAARRDPDLGGDRPHQAERDRAAIVRATPRGLLPGEGFVPTPGGRVWYRIVGRGDATPLLVIHGGPGGTHHACEPLAALGDERPVVFYDQLGCGRSDRPGDPTLWTPSRFAAEVAAVRAALRLGGVHIFAHSWGTIVAVEHLLSQPGGVKSVVLAGPCISVPRFRADAARLVSALPDSVRRTLADHEAAGTTDSRAYQAAAAEFLKRHVYRGATTPEALRRASAGRGRDVYRRMWGPTESCVTGTLAQYDRSDALGRLRVPVLYTAGRHDECTPETTRWYAARTPQSDVRIFEHSAHLPHFEETGAYVEAVREFLRRHD